MPALHGKKPYRGNAKILTVHFEREIDPTEWLNKLLAERGNAIEF